MRKLLYIPYNQDGFLPSCFSPLSCSGAAWYPLHNCIYLKYLVSSISIQLYDCITKYISIQAKYCKITLVLYFRSFRNINSIYNQLLAKFLYICQEEFKNLFTIWTGKFIYSISYWKTCLSKFCPFRFSEFFNNKFRFFLIYYFFFFG